MKPIFFTLMLLLGYGLSAPVTAHAQTMDKNEQMVRRFVAGYIDPNQDVLSLVDEVFVDDFIYEDVSSGYVWRNKEELAMVLADVRDGLEAEEFTLTNLVVSRDRGSSEWVWKGTVRSTGKSFSARGASMYQFQNGKIKRVSDYMDPASWLAATGK